MELHTLINSQGAQVQVIDDGATIISVRMPDRNGQLDEVVLGYDHPSQYSEGTAFFGALVGRFCNRIANGCFHLDGRSYQLATNNGPNHLHGGLRGFDKAPWRKLNSSQTTMVERGGTALVLTYTSADGEEGYPGTLSTTVRYTLTDDCSLWIDYHATTDRPTVLNLTNHSYFNLAGAKARNILGHYLTLHADRFTPVNATMIPTGELRLVSSTPFDFRTSQLIGSRIDAADEQLRLGHGYDHNFVLKGANGSLRLAAAVYEPTSGRSMEVHTTQPGVQFYTGNYLTGTPLGRHQQAYQQHSGFCLETQHFPDSPNQPHFPSTRLGAGEAYVQTTVYRFGVT